MALIKQKSHYSLLVLLGLPLVLGGCTSGYYKQPQARSLPKLPEVSRPARVRPSATALRRVKPSSAKIRKYSVTTSSVITQKEIAAVVSQETLKERAKQKAIVDIDPYASIPENNTSVVSSIENKKPITTGEQSSPAVKSLLIQAQADLAIGRSASAVSKLERGLRIESQNSKLWGLLAKAHYEQADYQQAISMSKKSIRYSSDDELISKNWALIKKAGLKSGDTTVVKEAINYIKLNP